MNEDLDRYLKCSKLWYIALKKGDPMKTIIDHYHLCPTHGRLTEGQVNPCPKCKAWTTEHDDRYEPVLEGSREWAVVMAMRGNTMCKRSAPFTKYKLAESIICTPSPDDDWYLLPPSPPPLRRGDRCRWWRGEDSGTGTYQCLAEPGVWDDDLRHVVKVATVTFAVDRVERIEP